MYKPQEIIISDKSKCGYKENNKKKTRKKHSAHYLLKGAIKCTLCTSELSVFTFLLRFSFTQLLLVHIARGLISQRPHTPTYDIDCDMLLLFIVT